MLRHTVLFAIIFAAATIISTAFTGKGSGTDNDPYQITNVEQLQEMNDELDAHYVLMNDIDASDTREWNVGDHDVNPETPDSAMGFEPVGDDTGDFYSDEFYGSLDGQNYTISCLYIYRPAERNVGLFGYISDGTYVHDVKLKDISVTGNNFVGGLFGRNYLGSIFDCNSTGNVSGILNVGGFCGMSLGGTISNCYCTGNVSGNRSVGGFCGNSSTGNISNCYCSGDITGTGTHVGGFCGGNGSRISDCYCSGIVTGNKSVGGFCGANGGWITDCYCTVDATGEDDNVGGFCGGNSRSIEDCYCTGNVTGYSSVCGFCGKNESSITDCYCTGDVTGYQGASGFCGWNYASQGISTISGCYCTGNVSGYMGVGGFCSSNSGSIEDCYCSGNASCEDKYCGGFCGMNRYNNNNGKIIACYCSGDVTGNIHVGGFCGMNSGNNCDCYCSGDVTGNKNVGGFCGINHSDILYGDKLSIIERSYSIGVINGNSNVGGFCGMQGGDGVEEINYCYWDTQTSGIDSSDGGEDKTTAEMKMKATFETWDFDNVWCMAEGKTYPHLQAIEDCETLPVKESPLPEKTIISIYPNPADNFIIVSIDNELEIISSIQIVDITGRTIREQLVDYGDNEIKISTSEIASGFYIVRIKTNMQSMSYPIIIK